MLTRIQYDNYRKSTPGKNLAKQSGDRRYLEFPGHETGILVPVVQLANQVLYINVGLILKYSKRVVNRKNRLLMALFNKK